MARPKKQTAEYFPHFVVGGKTIYILESNFGNDGYAFWFKVLELLGMTDGHIYDCRNTSDWEFLLAKTHVSKDIASSILQKLVDLDAIDRELWENKIIWSDNFVRNLLPLYNNRKGDLPKKPVMGSRNPLPNELPLVETPPSEITTPINPQRREEESKEEESIVEERENSVSEIETLSPTELISHNDEAINLIQYYETLKPGQFISTEMATLKIWLEKYKFDWVKEAIQMSVTNKGKFIKPWIEKVLENWTCDGKSPPITKKADTFNNYDQRTYDYNDLEKKLLGNQSEATVEEINNNKARLEELKNRGKKKEEIK